MPAAGRVGEPAREIPVSDAVDVVVCGGGPAGVAAAVGAARKGAKTLLVEQHGCLGGIWTSGLLCWLLDCGNKQGLMAEITRRMDERGARTFTAGGKTYSGRVEGDRMSGAGWSATRRP